MAAAPGLGADRDLAVDEDPPQRISIASAQEKTTLVRIDGQWCRPLGATPTTHILKLPRGLVGGRRLDLSESVCKEWLCAQLLRELGLPVAATDIGHFDGQLGFEELDHALDARASRRVRDAHALALGGEHLHQLAAVQHLRLQPLQLGIGQRLD